jgi:hypothetical protein
MLRRALFFVAMLFMALPLRAQSPGWTAWLFNQADGSMTQVSADGSVLATFRLPLPPGFDRYVAHVGVGHGGSPFAYMVYNSSTFAARWMVSDVSRTLAAVDLPPTLSTSYEILAGQDVFNEDDTAVALGYSLQNGGWEVQALDTRTGALTANLRSDMPLVAALGLNPSFTPIVRWFSGRVVTFTMVPTMSEGLPQYDSFAWNVDTDVLTQNAALTGLASDTLPSTGEIIMPLSDTRLPGKPQLFTFGFQSNTLQVYSPANNVRFPFLNAPDQSLSAAWFIQNGELILFGGVSPTDTQNTWYVARRDSTLVGSLPKGITIEDAHGVPDGFIYTTGDFTPGATALIYANTRGGLNAGAPVWTSGPGAKPVIAWVGSSVASAQTAYTPWAQLAPPVYDNGVGEASAQLAVTPLLVSPGQVATGAATPILSSGLAVGQLARVHTTDGDQLNVRLLPNLTADILAKVPDGDRVTLLEGPRYAEGFTWWKVRTAAGVEGWAVESVEDKGTRLQTLLPS